MFPIPNPDIIKSLKGVSIEDMRAEISRRISLEQVKQTLRKNLVDYLSHLLGYFLGSGQDVTYIMDQLARKYEDVTEATSTEENQSLIDIGD